MKLLRIGYLLITHLNALRSEIWSEAAELLLDFSIKNFSKTTAIKQHTSNDERNKHTLSRFPHTSITKKKKLTTPTIKHIHVFTIQKTTTT